MPTTFITILDKYRSKNQASNDGEQQLQAPQLVSPHRYPYGPFRFKTTLSKRTRYEVELTSNLKDWRVIASDEGNGEIEFLDSQASKFNHGFYRLHAEGTYSTNVVGYVTVTLPPGFSIIANPFEGEETTVAAMFNGWPDGTAFSKFSTQFHRLTETKVRRGKWGTPNERLNRSEGAIFYNPTLDYKVVSFVGDLKLEGFSIPIPAGFSLRSSPLPQPGQLDTDLGFPVDDGDEVHLFDRDRQAYVVHRFEAGGWTPSAPVVGVGESFWIGKSTPRNWTRQFPPTV